MFDFILILAIEAFIFGINPKITALLRFLLLTESFPDFEFLLYDVVVKSFVLDHGLKAFEKCLHFRTVVQVNFIREVLGVFCDSVRKRVESGGNLFGGFIISKLAFF